MLNGNGIKLVAKPTQAIDDNYFILRILASVPWCNCIKAVKWFIVITDIKSFYSTNNILKVTETLRLRYLDIEVSVE